MKKYVKHIVLATLFVVCAITTIWAINYDKSTTPLNNEITSGISGPINVPVQTVVNGVAAVNSTVNGVSYGQTITVNAPLIAGQVFLHWFDGARNKILSYQESYNYRVLSSNPDLRAVYIAEGAMQVIFIDANDNQIAVGIPSPNGGSFTVEAPAANLIPVRPGYAITGWSEDLNNIQLDLAGRAYVQAIYTRNSEEFPDLLTVHIEDTLYDSYDFGTVTTVTTPETKGEEVFSHWTIDGRIVSYSSTYSFTVHRDTVLIPVYSETYEPVEISYLDPNYFEYDFGYNKQVTFVGRYELPWDWQLVETGVLFYDGTLSGELTLETNNVRKVQSTNQNNNNEFTVTTLNRTVFSPYHARSYLVFFDGFDYTVVYGELITIDALEQTVYFYDFEGVTKGGYAEAVVDMNGQQWTFNDALVGDLANDRKVGNKSIRMQAIGYIQSVAPISNGITNISFLYAKYGTDGNATIQVSMAYATNPDLFIPLSTINVTSIELQKAVISLNVSNPVYIKISKSGGNRVNIDNLSINTAVDTTAPVFSGLSNKEVIIGQSFDSRAGVTALDDIDGNVTSRIQVTGTVDTNTLGTYNLEYTVSDYSGNTTVQSISVEVVDISDSQKADIAANNLTKPVENTEYTSDFTLSVTSSYGSTVEWSSNNAAITIVGANATVIRPTEFDLTIRLTWILTLNDEERSGFVDVIVLKAPTSPEPILKYHYDYLDGNTTDLNTNTYGDTSYTVKNLVDNNFITHNRYRVAANTTTSVTGATRALVVSPRIGTGYTGIAWAELNFGSDNIIKLSFDTYFWNNNAEQYFTKIELQVKNGENWVLVDNLLEVLAGTTTIQTLTYESLSGSIYRIYTEGGRSGGNDARLLIDNVKAYTNP